MRLEIGEQWRLKRLAAGDTNAEFETNEFDPEDWAAGGDGIVYAGTKAEAAQVRQSLASAGVRSEL